MLTQKADIILGANDFAKIKMGTCPRVGQSGESFAEQTKMGWFIMLLGRETDIVSALFTKTSVTITKNLFSHSCLTQASVHGRPLSKKDMYLEYNFMEMYKTSTQQEVQLQWTLGI